jgi:hypothetical protein
MYYTFFSNEIKPCFRDFKEKGVIVKLVYNLFPKSTDIIPNIFLFGQFYKYRF